VSDDIHHSETRFGFEYGDAAVERCWNHKGYVCISLISRTTGKSVEVTFSPKGHSVRVELAQHVRQPTSK